MYPPLVSATVGYIITSQCIPSFCLCHSWLHRSQLLRTFLWSVPQLVTAVYPPLVSGSWLHHNQPVHTLLLSLPQLVTPQPAFAYLPLVCATVGYRCVPSIGLCHSWLHHNQPVHTLLWSCYPSLFLCDHFISLLITMHLYCCMCILTDVRGNGGCLKFPFFKCLCRAACNHFYWGLVLVYSNLVLIFYALLHPLPPPVPIVFISQVWYIYLAVTHCIILRYISIFDLIFVMKCFFVRCVFSG